MIGDEMDPLAPAILFLAAVLFVGLFVEVCSPREQPMTWHERYVKDNCERCERDGNECCVYIPEGP
jgi:hypothetical protein